MKFTSVFVATLAASFVYARAKPLLNNKPDIQHCTQYSDIPTCRQDYACEWDDGICKLDSDVELIHTDHHTDDDSHTNDDHTDDDRRRRDADTDTDTDSHSDDIDSDDEDDYIPVSQVAKLKRRNAAQMRIRRRRSVSTKTPEVSSCAQYIDIVSCQSNSACEWDDGKCKIDTDNELINTDHHTDDNHSNDDHTDDDRRRRDADTDTDTDDVDDDTDDYTDEDDYIPVSTVAKLKRRNAAQRSIRRRRSVPTKTPEVSSCAQYIDIVSCQSNGACEWE